MILRPYMLAAMLVLGTLAVVAPVAPTASATHSCGFEPCPHPGDVFCLVVFKKFTPSLYQRFCPYA